MDTPTVDTPTVDTPTVDTKATTASDKVKWWIKCGATEAMSSWDHTPPVAWDASDRAELNDAILAQAAPDTAPALFILTAIIGEFDIMQTLWRNHGTKCYLLPSVLEYYGVDTPRVEKRDTTIRMAAYYAWVREDIVMMDWLSAMMPACNADWFMLIATLAYTKGKTELATRYLDAALSEMARRRMDEHWTPADTQQRFQTALIDAIEATYLKCWASARQWIMRRLLGVVAIDEEWLSRMFGETIYRASFRVGQDTFMRIVADNDELPGVRQLALIYVAAKVLMSIIDTEIQSGVANDWRHDKLMRGEQMMLTVAKSYLFDTTTGKASPETRASAVRVLTSTQYIDFDLYSRHIAQLFQLTPEEASQIRIRKTHASAVRVLTSTQYIDFDLYSRHIAQLFQLTPEEASQIRIRKTQHEIVQVYGTGARARVVTRLFERVMPDAESIRADNDQILCIVAKAKDLTLLSTLAAIAYPPESPGLHKNDTLLQAVCATGELDMLDWLLNTYYDTEAKRAAHQRIIESWPEEQREFIAGYVTAAHS